MGRSAGIVAAAALWIGMATQAATLPSSRPTFGEPQARNFLAHAKRVDRTTNPLTRCLAYPDIPGTAWPKGLAEAWCQDVFGSNLTLGDVRRSLDIGDLAGLQARLAADLASHGAPDGSGERIHRDFDSFDGSDESASLSAAWLAKAPGSAFALLARGTHFRHALNRLRGGRFPDAISEAEFRALSELAAQAIEHFDRALAVDPSLTEAYAGLVFATRLDDRDARLAEVTAKATALDPGCAAIADQVMIGLAPQWRGSLEAMAAYARTLEPRLASHPLLARPIARAGLTAGNFAYDAGRYDEALALAGAVVLAAPEPSASELLASALAQDESAPALESLVHLVAATRFQPGSPGIARARGRLIQMQIKDPEWSLPALEWAVAGNPDDGLAHLFLGWSYEHLLRGKEAQRQFDLALADVRTRGSVMKEHARRHLAGRPRPAPEAEWLAPAEAIRRANAAEPLPVPATFVIRVQAGARLRDTVFLNSEPDYKDPRCLTLAVEDEAAKALASRLGEAPETALKGKRVRVVGLAYKVPIFVGRNPVPVYFQTHVVVIDADQLEVVPEALMASQDPVRASRATR